MTTTDTNKHLLDRPGISNKIYLIVCILAVLAAIPDILSLFHIVYETHPYTEVEEIPVFYGLYSMICFLTLLVTAKAVQAFLKRHEDYYD
ncbi:MAG: hypothetical protein JKY04_09095 [Sneathiella sp.]|nr:hypothetical protein [Sneathiella sp.]